MARNVNDWTEVKYFLSNAPAETPLDELLLVAFSRWHVERCFEDQKTELGFDHFEGRSYLGLKRHQTVTAVTHLFLAEVRSELGEKNPELTVCQIRIAPDALVRSRPLGVRAARLMIEAAAAQIAYYQQRNAAARRSHTKTTLQKLHNQGVYVSDLPRCKWET